ncbi:LptA/OstA family protein [Candidatus Rariloculus sp.]|uniref:LptA/OstA family protein n=1 Tax=Candidatus Rariloculus sp. TaxID=3101265 RepID=UPI003D0C7CF3
MDGSFLRPPRQRPWLGALLLLCPCLAFAQSDEGPQTISLEATTTSIDRLSNSFSIEGVRITQGNLSIEADDATATGLDFAASDWQFSGNVTIAIGSAVITAESAVFSFDSHQLIKGDLLGDPVAFEETAPQGEGPVRGTSNRIHYDNLAGTVRMEGSAALVVGPNEIRGCDLIYDLAQEQVASGTSDCGEPFRILIVPKPEEEAPAPDSTLSI